MLDIEQIEKISQLARLELSEKEKKMYSKQLSVVFDYMKILDEVDTEDVKETCQVTGLEDVVREDVVDECDKEHVDKIVGQFPNKVDDLLKVRQVFE
jgi:aspartyl-tRNA(Asn)/glutamyl-tRNA(Gln) amidotransferase subunit C